MNVFDFQQIPITGTLSGGGSLSTSISIPAASGSFERAVLVVYAEFSNSSSGSSGISLFVDGVSVPPSVTGGLNSSNLRSEILWRNVSEADLPVAAGTYDVDLTIASPVSAQGKLLVWSITNLPAGYIFSFATDTVAGIGNSVSVFSGEVPLGNLGITIGTNYPATASTWLQSGDYISSTVRETVVTNNGQLIARDGEGAEAPFTVENSSGDGIRILQLNYNSPPTGSRISSYSQFPADNTNTENAIITFDLDITDDIDRKVLVGLVQAMDFIQVSTVTVDGFNASLVASTPVYDDGTLQHNIEWYEVNEADLPVVAGTYQVQVITPFTSLGDERKAFAYQITEATNQRELVFFENNLPVTNPAVIDTGLDAEDIPLVLGAAVKSTGTWNSWPDWTNGVDRNVNQTFIISDGEEPVSPDSYSGDGSTIGVIAQWAAFVDTLQVVNPSSISSEEEVFSPTVIIDQFVNAPLIGDVGGVLEPIISGGVGGTIFADPIFSGRAVFSPTITGGIPAAPADEGSGVSSIIDYLQIDPNFVEESKSLLLDQFKTEENVNLLLEFLIEAEEQFQELIVEWSQIRLLDNSYGVWLDEIGNQLGVPRTSNNDDAYKAAIITATRASVSTGTRDGIIGILQSITADTEVGVYIGGKVVEVNIFSGCFENSQSAEFISRFFPVLTFLRVLLREKTPFGFEGDDNALGFSSVTDTLPSGGGLCSRVYSTEDEL